MVASQMIESNFLYQRGHEDTASMNPRIRSVVMDIRARHGAMRILGIGHSAQLLCHDLHRAGYSAVGLDLEESKAINQTSSAPINRSFRPLIDPSPIKDAPFDMAISIELGESPLMPSILIKLAATKLQYGGVFILSIPYGGYLKNLLTTMRDWLTPPFFIPWDGGYIQRWSKKCLTNLLEAYGFTVVEIIGVRGSSLEWESIILVARKTGSQPSANDKK
jgi:2-polyprenyl-6-hydroxyphenyl methylase/3-demethylubiquinone-9 3-methyltransferase